MKSLSSSGSCSISVDSTLPRDVGNHISNSVSPIQGCSVGEDGGEVCTSLHEGVPNPLWWEKSLKVKKFPSFARCFCCILRAASLLSSTHISLRNHGYIRAKGKASFSGAGQHLTLLQQEPERKETKGYISELIWSIFPISTGHSEYVCRGPSCFFPLSTMSESH